MLAQEDLLTQKVELLLEMSSKKVLAELAKLHQEIAELKADVEELKKQRRSAPAPEPAPQYTQPSGPPPGYNPYAQQGYPQQFQQQGYQAPASRAPEPPQNWQPRGVEQPSPQEQRAKLDKPIDRNGVAPADVDIEKMFYFGNKKK